MSTKKDAPEQAQPAEPQEEPTTAPEAPETTAVRRFVDPEMAALAELGGTLVASGYFRDAGKASQAMVKVMAGRDLGLSAVASMTGIHLIDGKIEVGATLLAALVKRHPRYDYRVTQHTPEVCTIAFFETIDGHREQVGESDFTIADARKAGLVRGGSPWEKYPRAMLFARAMSQGVRWHCPDVTAGSPVYSEGEISGTDPGDLDYIDVLPTDPKVSPPGEKPPPTTSPQPLGEDAVDDLSGPGVPVAAAPLHRDGCASFAGGWCDCVTPAELKEKN